MAAQLARTRFDSYRPQTPVINLLPQCPKKTARKNYPKKSAFRLMMDAVTFNVNLVGNFAVNKMSRETASDTMGGVVLNSNITVQNFVVNVSLDPRHLTDLRTTEVNVRVNLIVNGNITATNFVINVEAQACSSSERRQPSQN